MLADGKGIADLVDLPHCDSQCILLVLKLDQQNELVAADSRQCVMQVQVLTKTQGDMTQQQVPSVMTEGIVHRFEAIKVHEHQCEAAAVLADLVHGLLDAIGQQRAVRQTGQAVVQRPMGKLMIGFHQRIGEHRRTRFEVGIENAAEQRDTQHRQAGHQHDSVQPVAAQPARQRTAETAIGKARRRHAGVVHADDGHAQQPCRTRASQIYPRALLAKMERYP
ncbi:hypothetical protein ALP75_204608 [Pseudomonas syringae pv. actinidiae]|nr:hypothetical protein ALP75_204608 [Pseudomonas syringae pv. actinidiae]